MNKQKKQILSLMLLAGVVFTNFKYVPQVKPVKPVQTSGKNMIRPFKFPDGIRVINNY